MVCGRSRYLDGSEAKVKEVTLEHLTLYGLPSPFVLGNDSRRNPTPRSTKAFDKGVSAAGTVGAHRLLQISLLASLVQTNFHISRSWRRSYQCIAAPAWHSFPSS